MARLRVQSQHLKVGDVVGSGEIVTNIVINSTQWATNKVKVSLNNRVAYWGKYTMINIEREEEANHG